MDPYMGLIMLWPIKRIPDGWHVCDGTLLSVSQYNALFTLLGTTYGGDGVKNFALPNLAVALPMCAGTGQGLTPRKLATYIGTETVSLTAATTPPHTHSVLTANATLDILYNGGLPVSEDSASTATPTSTSAIAGASTDYDNGGGQVSIYNFGVTAPTVSLTNSISVTGLDNPPTAVSPYGGVPHSNIQPTMGMNYIICINGLYPPRP